MLSVQPGSVSPAGFCQSSWVPVQVVLPGGHGWHIDIHLHGGEGLDLAPRPAPLPLPPATGGPLAKPAVSPRLPDDALVVIDVGDASHCHHACLQHLGHSRRCECVATG